MVFGDPVVRVAGEFVAVHASASLPETVAQSGGVLAVDRDPLILTSSASRSAPEHCGLSRRTAACSSHQPSRNEPQGSSVRNKKSRGFVVSAVVRSGLSRVTSEVDGARVSLRS